jgi:catechol 1,2-dioxygenase
MRRREFTKLTGLSAIAISTSGFIKFNGSSYEGNCETTTDILGPFYRPDSPVRNNLVIEGTTGDLIELSGMVRHKDCQTPYKNAKVELWHCSAEEVYDNDSAEYRYRGTSYADAKGEYKFTTQMPVPYDAGGGLIRPAHFHLMVSAPGYQSLITQIYFSGDPYLEKDISSSSSDAELRVLDISEAGGIKKVAFDCNMNDRLKASYSSLRKIVGKYKNDGSDEMKEFFEKDNVLWMKNEVFGESFEYVGDNNFEYGGMPSGLYERLHFDFQKDGTINLKLTSIWEKGNKVNKVFTKV